MMKLVKTLLVILAAAAVIGFFYFLTLMSPGKSVKAPSEYIDPSVESSQLLKESEELEAEFEKSASAGIVSAPEVDKLRKAIRLQEIYIEKARATSSDRAPMNRLTRLRTRLHNVEAEPLSRLVADFEKNARSAEESGDSEAADRFYRQAYDIQDKINRGYWLSDFKSVTKVVEIDKAIKNLQVRPMYEESLAAEQRAKEAVSKSDWKAAVAEYEKAVQISRDISLKFPTSGYNDYMRIQRMRGELDSLKSSDLKVEIEKLLGEADGLQKKGEFAAASDRYAMAAVRQKDINQLFPRSIHASEERLSEYSNLSTEAKSRIYAAEVSAIDREFTEAVRSSDIAKASDLSSNLVARVEQFRKDFPRNSDITSEDLIRVRYLNFTIRQIADIQKLVKSALLPVGSGGKKMLKTEVTQKLYSLVMQENPSRNQSSEDNPVESVTYQEAMTFCQRLGWILGMKVSLPTEAEFVDAVGNLRYADIDAISWNASNSGGSIHPVAAKKANDKGFFDLLGNVGEFVLGVEEGSARVLGGGAQTSADAISVLPRAMADANQRNRMTGFRITVSE
ncbi:MAG: SUMF1/EgtB/PvdO family nonheme iron enzyme [Opitutales bacterium]|nr:SUMF1/EgtB/PvdO family nonheme iron enzyme [Opitutales bacterium]